MRIISSHTERAKTERTMQTLHSDVWSELPSSSSQVVRISSMSQITLSSHRRFTWSANKRRTSRKNILKKPQIMWRTSQRLCNGHHDSSDCTTSGHGKPSVTLSPKIKRRREKVERHCKRWFCMMQSKLAVSNAIIFLHPCSWQRGKVGKMRNWKMRDNVFVHQCFSCLCTAVVPHTCWSLQLDSSIPARVMVLHLYIRPTSVALFLVERFISVVWFVKTKTIDRW